MGRELKRRSSKKLKNKENRTTRNVPVDFFSSGCIPINLALSGLGEKGGWARGRVLNIVGGRSAGKTAVALEAAFAYFKTIKRIRSKIWPRVKKFNIVYNNAEGVMDFDVERMYGPEFYDKVKWIRSPNVEHFGRDYFRHVDKLLPNSSLLYILDTLDFLKSKESLVRFAEAVDKDEIEKGSYDTEKQKYLSSFFATTSEFLDHNGKDATLMILSQVRDKIGVVFGKKQMRTGGRAFDHAIHQEAWVQEFEKMRATKLGEKKVYAIKSRIRVEKNKCAKPFREANFMILYDYGIDNINSMIDYLYGPKSKKIKFDGQSFNDRKEFIKFIEGNEYERLLAEQTEIKWQKVEEAFEKEVKDRKRRW
jgi:RecA/RadA recombinase